MNKPLAVIAITFLIPACHAVKEKTGEVIDKAGETVGRSATQFIKGVGKGIDEVTGDVSDFSAFTKDDGLRTGKIVIADSAGRENVISVYFIFDKDFNKNVRVTVIDKNGLEYGRTKKAVSGKKGEAAFSDFYFDGRTSFESHSKFVFEPADK